MQSVSGLLLKILNTTAARSKNYVLFGNLFVIAVESVGGNGGEPLA